MTPTPATRGLRESSSTSPSRSTLNDFSCARGSVSVVARMAPITWPSSGEDTRDHRSAPSGRGSTVSGRQVNTSRESPVIRSILAIVASESFSV